jgi:transposase
MRRTHLRGHTNILKRLLIHAGGFNLGLVMRHLIGSGTPRGLQDRLATVIATLSSLMGATRRWLVTISAWQPIRRLRAQLHHRRPPQATPQW